MVSKINVILVIIFLFGIALVIMYWYYYTNNWILYYDGIEVSEGPDVNKIKNSRKSIIGNYDYFHKVNFRFQLKVCDGYFDLMQKAKNINEVTIVNC